MLENKMVELVNTLSQMVEDAKKADIGNASAARRLRVAVQGVKKDLQEVRILALNTYSEKKVKVNKSSVNG